MLDGHGLRAGYPIAPQFAEPRQDSSDVNRPVDAERRTAFTLADLDRDVRPAQRRKRILIRYVIAEKNDCRRADEMPNALQRIALVGLHDAQLDDLLALFDMHACPGRSAVQDAIDDRTGL